MSTDLASFVSDPETRKLVGHVLESASKVIFQFVKDKKASVTRTARVRFLIGFSDYLKSSYDKCRIVKTIISPDEPIPTEKLYVNVQLEANHEIIDDDVLIDRIEEYKLVVIEGSAGSGKSWFMKRLILRRLVNPLGKIPLLIELRHLNNDKTPDLLTFIHKSGTAKNTVKREEFDLAMSAGSLLLVLDGLDEVERDHRDTIERQILDIGRLYPEASVIVSSRSDERFGSWGAFYVFQMQGLNKNQVIELVNKQDFDDTVKVNFIDDLKSGLYEKHKSFLSYPLLVTIMLLTYKQYASVANKVHIFYEQAFETLYLKHDAMKDQFKRKKYTDLAIDEFRECLSIFSAISYFDEKFSFTVNESREYASISLTKFDANVSKLVTIENFVKDLIECVCVLQYDGLGYSFVHRSFQEYFTAVFCANCNNEDIVDVIDKLSDRFSDSVLTMLLEMAKEKVEQEWVRPRLGQMIEKIEEINQTKSPSSLIKMFISGLHFTRFKINGKWANTTLVGFKVESSDQKANHTLIMTLARLYPDIFQDKIIYSYIDRAVEEHFLKILVENGYGKDPRFRAIEKILRDPLAAKEDDDYGIKRGAWKILKRDDAWLSAIGCDAAIASWAAACHELDEQIGKRKQDKSTMIRGLIKRTARRGD